jgi:hypothetical protein
MNLARKMSPRILKPGDPVPESGIYKLLHRDCPSRISEMILVAGDTIPPCRHCGTKLRLQLAHAAPHIYDDRDFLE